MKRIYTACIAMLIVACIIPTDACGCSPTLAIGTVAGVVRTASGSPAADAAVRVEARLTSCDLDEPSALVDAPTTRTDSAGRYLYRLRTISTSDSACLRLVARASGAGPSDSAVVSGIRMRLISSHGLTGWGDSTRVDLRLP
jgi:hypothetical protein